MHQVCQSRNATLEIRDRKPMRSWLVLYPEFLYILQEVVLGWVLLTINDFCSLHYDHHWNNSR